MIILLLLVRVLVFALGAYLVFRACLSALRTFVLPRGVSTTLARMVFIHTDIFHALYYLFMHFWVVLGTSPTVIRIPSVINPRLSTRSKSWRSVNGPRSRANL